MCIIIAKKRGYELPGKDILERCWNRNSQGAGIAYTKNGAVKIEKGFMKKEELLYRLETLGNEIDIVESAMLIHFRISTSGNVDEGNCHPYPVTDDKKKIRELELSCDLAIAHNGMIYDFTNAKSIFNDSQLFIMKVLVPLYRLNSEHDFYKHEKIRYLISNSINDSRIAFLDKNGDILTIGKWYEENGIQYSNNGYKKIMSYGVGKRKAKTSRFIRDSSVCYVDGAQCSKEYFNTLLEDFSPLTEEVYDVNGYEIWSPNDGLEYYVDDWSHEIYLLEEETGSKELVKLGEYI